MNDTPQPKNTIIRWFQQHRLELGLFCTIIVLSALYFFFPELRDSLKNVYFAPIAIGALLLGWQKSSAFTVLGVSLVLCITCNDWGRNSATEFFQLVIWGCTLGATSAFIGLIVMAKDKQVLRLLERQNSLALTDQLTQVANRRAFDNELRRRLSECTRYRRDLSVLMVDIDFFKQFNDRYGHGVGDIVLQTIARTIENSLRDADLVARFGGEEFAVLLPNTNVDESMIVAERIRNAVDQIAESDVNCPEQVSVSIGITEVEFSDTQATILERADIAMYEAKRNGRNRVCTKRLSCMTGSSPTINTDQLLQSVFDDAQTSLQQAEDSVTGLAYLKIFDNELQRRMYESARYEVDLCLGLIRLTHGNSAEVNKADIRAQMANIGRTINKSLRESDLVTWYSPCEFAVMLPFTGLQDGGKVLQRLYFEISSERYQTGINSLFQVDSVRVVQLDGCETKNQALEKLNESQPLAFSATGVLW